MLDHISEKFTEEQRLAASSIDEQVAVLAGAGSGKTAVLTERYLRLLQEGLKPNEILTVTFTNEAADQMRSRILDELTQRNAAPALYEAALRTPFITTMHGLCYHLVDHFGSALGLRPVESILSTFELAGYFEEAFDAWLRELGEEVLRDLLTYYSHTEIRELASAFYKQRHVLRKSLRLSPGDPFVQRIVSRFEPLLNRVESHFNHCGIYDFDDLEELAFQILEKSNTERVQLLPGIKRIMVDEFQDTSRAQWDIIQALLGCDAKKLFVVGDPKQSIYGFRHADVKVFLQVMKSLEGGSGSLQTLSHNFRTHPDLLAQINALSESLFQGSEIPFSALKAGKVEADSFSELRIKRYGRDAQKLDLAQSEMLDAAKLVQDLIEAGERADSIALLFRVSELMKDYHTALSERGIPAHGRRTLQLFDCYDTLDLGNFLRALDNPSDCLSLAAFLKSPFVGFSDSDVVSLMKAPGDSLFTKLTQAPMEAGALAWFVEIAKSRDLKLEEALRVLFSETNYFPSESEAFLEWLEPLTRTSLSVKDAVKKLKAWEKVEPLFQSDRGGEGVSLMTVHGAKGLEFKHVFLVDNLRRSQRRSPLTLLHPDHPPGLRYRVKGEIVTSPSYDQIEQGLAKSETEQSKRLLYVALTRAEQTLTVFLPADATAAPKGSWAALLEEGLRNTKIDEKRRGAERGHHHPFCAPPLPPRGIPPPLRETDGSGM